MINHNDSLKVDQDSLSSYQIALKEYVEGRIRILKEEMFFESAKEEK